ncbi:MAG: ATP-binding cassette domain-containing protein [Deltaproteobacteria bacterium]|jgi:ABC-2 type transport system ATP-binding protein|nr:ATP-binding cassette domain-containing protein [Deltaproteobacteria bacterium]
MTTEATSESLKPAAAGSLEPAITISNLIKNFQGQSRCALNNATATVYPGRTTGLVGPDGAGKSTLLRLLCGLLDPDGGQVRVLGFDPMRQAPRVHAICGYMPQKFGLYEDLTVIENLNLYSDIRGLERSQRDERFKVLLRFTDLGAFTKRLAGRLSGGMKQKLGLACVLIGSPKVLLLDEPSVGVDPVSRRELWSMVQSLAQGGLAVVWATSYLDEAQKCEAVILLDQGRVLFEGPPGELVARIDGRSWFIGSIAASERRRTLLELLRSEQVVDGLITAGGIRVMTAGPQRPSAGPGTALTVADDYGKWAPSAPTFEDAFIDLLGGGARGESALGAHFQDKLSDQSVVVEAKALTKKFGDFTAVSSSSFQISRGEIFGLLGPNGAGKSTIFKMMCGLLTPTSGLALIAGIDLRKAPARARGRLGYMAQKFSLYESLSAAENLEFFSGAYGLSGRVRKERVGLMIEIFDLKHYLGSTARTLPLGFKQRLALACAVMHEPDVLFLDEPTSGVDPVTRREFWLHINSLAHKGVAVMVTTHFMEEAEYCDRVTLVYQGLGIASGTPDDLKNLATESGLGAPTMEDAFVFLIEKNRAQDREGSR